MPPPFAFTFTYLRLLRHNNIVKRSPSATRTTRFYSVDVFTCAFFHMLLLVSSACTPPYKYHAFFIPQKKTRTNEYVRHDWEWYRFRQFFLFLIMILIFFFTFPMLLLPPHFFYFFCHFSTVSSTWSYRFLHSFTSFFFSSVLYSFSQLPKKKKKVD